MCAVDIGQGVGVAHWFGASSATPKIGTLIPSPGTANVWDAVAGSIALIVLPSTWIVPPSTPRGFDHSGLRRPLWPSKLYTVTWTRVLAGRSITVLCCHAPLSS